ncbi:efflux RND transporter periplasmic adaptor subunit [Chitinimonas lacunae]|uniref:Efflux RND transporter periplasmic adaptor subunit n=1 Tax=Chitinimonas lacunae TaxID=1963018 RepID=A0ABV8MIX9_9NEIS
MLQAQPRRFARKPIAWALALVAVVGLGPLLSVQRGNAAPSKAAPEKVAAVLELSSSDLLTVQRGSLALPLPLSGTLSPVRQTLVGAEVEGVVAEVLVRPGQPVKPGQVLARLDTSESRNQLLARQANLERARAELRLAEKNRERSANLLKQNFISPNSHDAAENSYAVAQAQYKADEAQVALAQKSVGDAVVRAPFGGIVSERHIEPGARVGINQKLFGIVDLSELEFEAGAPTSRIAAVQVGQEVGFKVEGFGERRFSGRVERIAPVAQSGSRLIPLFVRVQNGDGALRGGMFVQGELTLARADDAALLPVSAIRDLDSAPYVLTVEQGRVQRRPVRLGLLNELSKQVAITEGVKPGDTVLITKLENLKPGQAVKLPSATPVTPAKTA